VSNFLNNLLCQSKRLAITGAVVLLTAPFAAKADTASTTMAVTALVLKVCVVAATPMVFGNYTATNSTPTDATSTIVVTCTNGTTYDVDLDAGLAKFERGMELATELKAHLSSVENRVEKIRQKFSGAAAATTQPEIPSEPEPAGDQTDLFGA